MGSVAMPGCLELGHQRMIFAITFMRSGRHTAAMATESFRLLERFCEYLHNLPPKPGLAIQEVIEETCEGILKYVEFVHKQSPPLPIASLVRCVLRRFFDVFLALEKCKHRFENELQKNSATDQPLPQYLGNYVDCYLKNSINCLNEDKLVLHMMVFTYPFILKAKEKNVPLSTVELVEKFYTTYQHCHWPGQIIQRNDG